MNRNDAQRLFLDLVQTGRLRSCRSLVSKAPNVLRYVAPPPFRSFTFVVTGELRRCFSGGGPDVETVGNLVSLAAVERLFGGDWEVLIWIAAELEGPVGDERLTRATWAKEGQEALNREVAKVVEQAARSRDAHPERSLTPINLRQTGGGVVIQVDYDKSLRTQAFLKSLGCSWDPLGGGWSASADTTRVEVFLRAWADSESRAVLTSATAAGVGFRAPDSLPPGGKAVPARVVTCPPAKPASAKADDRRLSALAAARGVSLTSVELRALAAAVEVEARKAAQLTEDAKGAAKPVGTARPSPRAHAGGGRPVPSGLLRALTEAGWRFEHSPGIGLLWVFPKVPTDGAGGEPEQKPQHPGVRFRWKGARRFGKAAAWLTEFSG